MRSWGWGLHDGVGTLIKRDTSIYFLSYTFIWVHIKMIVYLSQGGRSHPTILASQISVFSLWNSEKIHCCCLSYWSMIFCYGSGSPRQDYLHPLPLSLYTHTYTYGIYIYIYIYIHIYIHTHIYIYTHTHTHSNDWYTMYSRNQHNAKQLSH